MRSIKYLVALGALAGILTWAQASGSGSGQQAATPLTPQQQDVERTLKEQIASNPKDADARARLAGFYLSSDRSGQAIESYQDAITLRPEDPRLFLGLAIAYLHAGHHSMARAMTEQALSLDPHLTNAAKLREYIDRKQTAMRLHDQHAGLTQGQAEEALQAGAEASPEGTEK
jgi:cytochrome c-type biogenesis protein CcmH/NrfG